MVGMRLYDDQFIVITGGAGFIGSCLVRYLNDLGMNNIIIVDDLKTTTKWKNLVGKRFVDILSREKILEWLEEHEEAVEAIIHLGACSSTVEQDASYLLENNYRFSVRLAEYALRHQLRFIYASSAATYGKGEHGFSDHEEQIDKLHPINMYGYSKQLFDLWVKNQGLLNQVVGIKYFNVYGPNEYHKGRMASAILHMLRDAQTEGRVRLFKSTMPDRYPDGGQMRDFIYVKDAVRMTHAFLTNDVCGIFNVGTGQANTWNDLVKAMSKGLNKEIKIDYVDMPADMVQGYQNFTQADMAKTKKAIGAATTCMPFDKAVEQYVADYLVQDKRW
jgi:ADP-L-glycero-D-manno-heptose 6-epimerase